MTLPGERERLRLGDTPPDFDLRATDGERFSLSSFSEDQVLVVLVLANHCSFVAAWEDRMIMLAVERIGRGAAFVAVGAGNAKRHPEDSLEGMARRARERHYPFPYLFDEHGALVRGLGATVTPEAFVFDHRRRLQYYGAVDSDPRNVDSAPFLQDAIDALIANRPSRVAHTEPVGCPIELLP